MEKSQQATQKYKGSQRLRSVAICQQNGQLGRNGRILRKVQPSKTEPGRNRKILTDLSQTQKLKL